MPRRPTAGRIFERTNGSASLVLGYSDETRNITVNTQPIHRFEAWKVEQGARGHGRMELSTEFYHSLLEHAVPLDQSALAVLKHSALCLDIYAWLAQRLWRVR